MRGLTDALRSVARHCDLLLNDGPAPLGEVYYATHAAPGSPVYRWTTRGIAPGCLDVGEAAWMWLREVSGHAPGESVVGAGRRWERRRLLWDPTPYLVKYGLPTTGTPVAAPGSLDPLPENPWEVRLWGGRGEVAFPFCRVSLTASLATIPQGVHYYTAVQPMSVECYPTDRAADEEQAILLAASTIDRLARGFRGDAHLGAARPLRVPLYDYEEVPLEEGVSQRRLDPDYLSVADFAARSLPDPTDPRRVAAIADVRLSWRVAAEVDRGKWLVESVPVTQEVT